MLASGSPNSCISLIFGFLYSIYSPRLHSRSLGSWEGLCSKCLQCDWSEWTCKSRVKVQLQDVLWHYTKLAFLFAADVLFLSPSIVLVARQLLWWCLCVLQIKFASLFLKFLIWNNVAGFKIYSYYLKEFEHCICHLNKRKNCLESFKLLFQLL